MISSAGDIRAGRAYVEIGGDESQLVRTLNASAKRLQQFGSAIRGIGLQISGAGAAVVSPLALAGKSYAEHGEALEKGSKKTGLSVEGLSTLSYAAQQTGTDADALQTGIAKMSRTLTQAAEGSKQATAALGAVGVTVQQLNSLSQEDRIKKLADGIAAVKDPAAQAAAAMGIFGRGGAELLPLLTQGSNGIEAMQKHARDLGLQWSGPDAAAAAKFNRSLKDLWDVAMHGVDVIGGAVAPVLQQAARWLTGAAIAATGWIKQHQQLIATALKVGAAVLAVGTGLVIAGTAISAAGIALGTLGSSLGIVAKLFSPVAAGVGLLTTGFRVLAVSGVGVLTSSLGLLAGTTTWTAQTMIAAFTTVGRATLFLLNPIKTFGAVGGILQSLATGALAVVSPVMILGAAIVGLGGYFLYASGVAGTVFSYLRNLMSALPGVAGRAFAYLGQAGAAVGKYLSGAFFSLKADALSAFGGIMDALKAGDWQTAAQILWTGIKLEFDRGINALAPVVRMLIGGISTAWGAMVTYMSNWDGIVAAASMAALEIKSIWAHVTNEIADKLARVEINTQAEADTRAKYEGKTLTRKQAEGLSTYVAPERRQQIRAAHPELNENSPQLQSLYREDQQKLEKYFGDIFQGAVTPDKLGALISFEQEFRQKQRERDDEQHNKDELTGIQSRIDQIKTQFAEAHPDRVAAGDAAAQKLQDALATINPNRTDEIAALQKELAALRTKSAEEAKKNPEGWKNVLASLGLPNLRKLPEAPEMPKVPDQNDLEKSIATDKGNATKGAFNIAGSLGLNALFGSDNGGAAKETAKNTRKTNEYLALLVNQKPRRATDESVFFAK